jgi:hypothetical protein
MSETYWLKSKRKTRCRYCPDPIPANSPHLGIARERLGNPYWPVSPERYHLGCAIRFLASPWGKGYQLPEGEIRFHTVDEYVNMGIWPWCYD